MARRWGRSRKLLEDRKRLCGECGTKEGERASRRVQEASVAGSCTSRSFPSYFILMHARAVGCLAPFSLSVIKTASACLFLLSFALLPALTLLEGDAPSQCPHLSLSPLVPPSFSPMEKPTPAPCVIPQPEGVIEWPMKSRQAGRDAGWKWIVTGTCWKGKVPCHEAEGGYW